MSATGQSMPREYWPHPLTGERLTAYGWWAFWQRRFRAFWGGVAGWPRTGSASYGSAVRYHMARGRTVPDFAIDEHGLIQFTARRFFTPLGTLHSTGAKAPREV